MKIPSTTKAIYSPVLNDMHANEANDRSSEHEQYNTVQDHESPIMPLPTNPKPSSDTNP